MDEKVWSGPVSRILFPVRDEDHSSATRVAAVVKQPTRKLITETGGSMTSLFGLAPQGVCRAAHTRVGRGALLPHRFTLTSSSEHLAMSEAIGGLFSVALSVASPRLAVSQPAARESSDFPRRVSAAILQSTPHGEGNRIRARSFQRGRVHAETRRSGESRNRSR
jgi:hypothetical protein